MVIFCLQVLKGAEDAKKKKRLGLDEIKQKLVESIIVNDIVENDELKKKAEEVEEPEKAAEGIKECENIIKTNKIDKTTIIFKINIYKLCERFPKLLNSSIGLGFFKNYFRSIKEICMENEKEFS